MFLEKKLGRKDICSQAYLKQVLEAMIFPLFKPLDKEQCIFIEDGSKVHKGKARLPRLNAGIRGFAKVGHTVMAITLHNPEYSTERIGGGNLL